MWHQKKTSLLSFFIFHGLFMLKTILPTLSRCLLIAIPIFTTSTCLAEDKVKQSPPVSVKKECTDLPASEWLSEEEFKVLMRYRGYKDFKFKIVYQSCYEIYGYDAKNELVEAYFNPTNAKLNRANSIKGPVTDRLASPAK